MNCQVLGQSHSGVEYYAAGLINHLAEVAPDNGYIVFANRQSNGLDHLQSKHRVAIHRSRGIACYRLGRIVWEHTVLPCLARRHRLDLLHCPAYICPVVKTLPTVVTVHDTIALDHPEWCRSANAWYYGLLLKHSILAAGHVITVSNASAARIAHHVPGAKHKTTVIYPGLDPLFQPVRDPGALDLVRRRYNLPERYVLYVGNLEPKKNLPRLILAFQQFRRRGNANWNLVIIGGKTWGLAAQMEQLRYQGQLQNVTFPGYVRREDLPAVYCQAGVFAFPSLCEGFGFPPLEAMACGVPVVASGCGALAETLPGAARQVDALCVESIAEGLHALVRDDDLRHRLAQAGRARAAQFTWADAAHKTLSVYDHVLKSAVLAGTFSQPLLL